MTKKTFRRIMLILLAAAFLLCAAVILPVELGYKKNQLLYKKASNSFTTPQDPNAAAAAAEGTGTSSDGTETKPRKENPELAPIVVDFDKMKEINPEVIGWIYCPNSRIDFPVCQAEDNKFYISHNYALESSKYGAIFADCLNRRDFVDSNTILYGHHLTDGTMFAQLDKWVLQDWFDEHPTMWILTPEQDYRVDLFSAYYISALDRAYTIFQGPSPEMDDWLQYVKTNSMVTADVELDGEAKYVMLSTCAYVFALSRSVVHGKMVPIDSAGGILLP